MTGYQYGPDTECICCGKSIVDRGPNLGYMHQHHSYLSDGVTASTPTVSYRRRCHTPLKFWRADIATPPARSTLDGWIRARQALREEQNRIYKSIDVKPHILIYEDDLEPPKTLNTGFRKGTSDMGFRRGTSDTGPR